MHFCWLSFLIMFFKCYCILLLLLDWLNFFLIRICFCQWWMLTSAPRSLVCFGHFLNIHFQFWKWSNSYLVSMISDLYSLKASSSVKVITSCFWSISFWHFFLLLLFHVCLTSLCWFLGSEKSSSLNPLCKIEVHPFFFFFCFFSNHVHLGFHT